MRGIRRPARKKQRERERERERELPIRDLDI